MKKVTAYIEHKEMKHQSSKSVKLWEEETAAKVMKEIDANKPIDIYRIMAESLTREILSGFKMIEIISIKDSCNLKESKGIYMKLTTEIIIRFATSKTKMCYLLAILSKEEIQACMEILVGYEEYEIVCSLRDELNNRK
jgi:hypothetical protein